MICLTLFVILWNLLVMSSDGQHIGDVQLVGGSVPHEGRMELYLGARGWFTTCDVTWTILDATVVCRQLGYPGVAFATLGAEFGRSTEKHLLARTWNCTGSERKLGQCHYQPTYPCNDVVGVICQDPSYIGCFNDERGIFHSFLQEDYFISSSLTIESCKEFCSEISHPIIGLKNGGECYCGDSRDVITGHSKYPDASCQKPCSGNERQICGGTRTGDHDSISVFDVNLGECEDPGVPTNGIRLSEWFKFGDVVKFYCDPGYEMVGASVVQCIITKRSDGHAVHWNESTPTCVKERNQSTDGSVIPSGGPSEDTTKPTNMKTQSILSSEKSRSPFTGNDVDLLTEGDITYFTELFDEQTEILQNDEVPKNGLFGLPEHLTILVGVAGIFVVCLMSTILISITKKIICRKRRAYHSINIERRLSEETNPDGAYVYEPLTESGLYSKPLRSSLRRGFKRLSRRPWSDLDQDGDSDEAL
ncbi:uncharacterized protein [Apostichopus japonicus]|uniref:uncharacterized protein isoform X2 n=1 Tax=Stichopus japonicus TaxID=307972 RepID=UPI003AB63EFE